MDTSPPAPQVAPPPTGRDWRGPFVLEFENSVVGPFRTRDAALAYGSKLAAESPELVSFNAAPLSSTATTTTEVDAGSGTLFLRCRCRCGRMVLEPAPGCVWHEARAEQARGARELFGSVEW